MKRKRNIHTRHTDEFGSMPTLPSAPFCPEANLPLRKLHPRILLRKASSHWHWDGSLFFESYFKTNRSICDTRASSGSGRTSALKPRLKSSCSTAPSSSEVRYFVKAAEVIGIFLEIGRSPSTDHIPKCPNHGHEGGLAGAVLTHEQRQRR